MRDAAEPEERAAEEKRVESKSWERKVEKMGSEEKESRTEKEGENGVEVAVWGVGVDGGCVEVSLNVARR